MIILFIQVHAAKSSAKLLQAAAGHYYYES